MDFHPIPLPDTVLVQPFFNDAKIGQNSEVISGTVDLNIQATNRYLRQFELTGASLVYTIDGTPIGGKQSWGDSVSLDTTTLSEGQHVLGVTLIGGRDDLHTYHSVATGFIVDNDGQPHTGQQLLPTLGNEFVTKRWNTGAADWVPFDGTMVRPHNTPQPLEYVYSAPVGGGAAPTQGDWMVESLVHANSSLYTARPVLSQTEDGHPIIAQHYPQSGLNATDAGPKVLRDPTFAGERNDNLVSPYATYVPDPDGPGWIGVDLAGWVYHVDEHGKVTTIAGRENKRDVLPLDERDPNITQAEVDAHQAQWVGTNNVPEFDRPHDVLVDPRDSNILYIADSFNHVITKIDRSTNPPQMSIVAGLPHQAGTVDGGSDAALFNKPYALAMVEDKTTGEWFMFVADTDSHAIRRIDEQGNVTTLVDSSDGIERPFVIRLDSQDNLILGEDTTGKIKRINPFTGAIELVAEMGGRADAWIWLDVDRKGNVGPVDDIIWVASQGAANRDAWRISADGQSITDMQNGSLGLLEHRNAPQTHDPLGHYPWAIAIDDEESRFIAQGVANTGLRSFRLIQPGDPDPANYDHQAYARGRNIFISGTALGLPFGLRPSFTALRGLNGHGYTGLPNFDDLAAMTDEELAAYIQSGMGGVVERPEITGVDLRNLIYFIRMNTLDGMTNIVNPGPLPTDVTAPVVSDVNSWWQDDKFYISWTTDEETLGFVGHGVTENLHRWSDLEDSYGLNHLIELDYLPDPGEELHFLIYARDEAGNQGFSNGLSVTVPSGQTAMSEPGPLMTLLFGLFALGVVRRFSAHTRHAAAPIPSRREGSPRPAL